MMTRGRFGKRFGDKGSRSRPLFDRLFGRGLHLITPLKRKMKNKLLPLLDTRLTGKRAIIETLNDQLKTISQTCAYRPSPQR